MILCRWPNSLGTLNGRPLCNPPPCTIYFSPPPFLQSTYTISYLLLLILDFHWFCSFPSSLLTSISPFYLCCPSLELGTWSWFYFSRLGHYFLLNSSNISWTRYWNTSSLIFFPLSIVFFTVTKWSRSINMPVLPSSWNASFNSCFGANYISRSNL